MYNLKTGGFLWFIPFFMPQISVPFNYCVILIYISDPSITLN